MCAKLLQLCLTLCNHMEYSPPSSSVHRFSRQESWNGLPFPIPRIFPTQGLKPCLLCLLHWQADSLLSAPPGREQNKRSNCLRSLDHGESKRVPKNIHFCFTDSAKAFVSMDHNKLENSERDGSIRPPHLSPEKPICRPGSNS